MNKNTAVFGLHHFVLFFPISLYCSHMSAVMLWTLPFDLEAASSPKKVLKCRVTYIILVIVTWLKSWHCIEVSMDALVTCWQSLAQL